MTGIWNPESLVGTRLGTCVLERPLGVGGMGAVYLARQERPRRQVAVKVLRPQVVSPQEWPLFLARFQREADATAALDHANIMPIYAFGEEQGIAFLVMPYLGDGSLAALLSREGPLALDRAIIYLEQVAAALDCAHQHGIVHRDVKPSNLLLHPDGRLLLADFGIARPLDRAELLLPAGSLAGHALDDATLTQAGMTMGTPQYMAPEQIQGLSVSAAADIYALGTVAYTMLTGQTPFGGGETVDILRRQLTEPPLPLRTTRPDVPARVEETIFWALAKAPEDRPASAGAFGSALREATRGSGLGAIFTRVAPFRGGSRTGMVGRVEPQVTPAVGRRIRTGTLPLDAAMHPQLAAQLGMLGTASAPPPGEGLAGNAPTLYGQRLALPGGPDSSGKAPAWPLPQPVSMPRSRHTGARIFAGVAAIGLMLLLVGVVLAGGGQVLAGLQAGQPSSAGPNGAHAAALATATATVTPSPTTRPTATPVANWLHTSTTSLALGCGKHATSQVVLTNGGPESTDWNLYLPVILPGITASPTSGSLDPGERATINVTNTSTYFEHSGTFLITPHNPNAGAAVQINYTAPACANH